MWKDISSALNIGPSASAAFNVRKKYISLGIFHYECKYDLNGVDPQPFIAEMDKNTVNSSSKKKSAKNAANGDLNSSLTQVSAINPNLLNNNSNSSNPTTPSSTSKKKKKDKEKKGKVSK